jgi:hypothetical protein
MINSQYVKFGSLTGLICTLMLMVTAAVSHTPVLAQITPAPEKFGNDESSINSSPSTDNGNEDDHGSTDSSSSHNNDDEGSDTGTEDSTSSDYGESADTSDSNDDSGPDTIEQDFDSSNSLMESIMNRVNDELSAAGIATPGFGS